MLPHRKVFFGTAAISLLPNKTLKKALFAEDLVHQPPKVLHFAVVAGHKDHTIFAKQIPCEVQPRVHHAQPPRMEAAVGVGVGPELLSFRVRLPGVLEVRLKALRVVVRIDEIFASVIRRVDVDHLHLPQVRLLEKLQNFEVVALDDEVLGRVEVDALLTARPQRPQTRRLDCLEAIRLARPGKPVALLPDVHGVAERQLEPVKVQLAALGAHLRKQAQQLLAAVFGHIMRTQVQPLRHRRARLVFGFAHRDATSSVAGPVVPNERSPGSSRVSKRTSRGLTNSLSRPDRTSSTTPAMASRLR